MKRGRVVNAGVAARERCVYGAHAVGEWVRVRPQHVQRIAYDPRAGVRVAGLVALAQARAIPTQPITPQLLAERAGTPHHQGIIARTHPFPYAELDEVVGAAPRLLIVADHMQDPHNLGALLRAADGGGVGAVIVPKDASVPVTPTVEAVAAGAAARLRVCRVVNIARALKALKARGYWAAGLVPRGGVDLYGWEAPQPLVVVVGGEGGMRRLVAGECDSLVSIPMVGETESLNAAVAAAVVIFELLRRWRAT